MSDKKQIVLENWNSEILY